MENMSELERDNLVRGDKHISPREAELIKYRDNRTALVIKLMNGETLEGAVRWYDGHALRLVQSDRSEMTVYLQAIAYYKARA